jgi:hypothetical protein
MSDCISTQPWLHTVILQVVLTIEAICSTLAFMPTNPADGTIPTLQVLVDALPKVWVRSSGQQVRP